MPKQPACTGRSDCCCPECLRPYAAYWEAARELDRLCEQDPEWATCRAEFAAWLAQYPEDEAPEGGPA